jgi:GntR family transcriptional regulator
MATTGPLDSSSPLPLYYQLKELLRDRIASGAWRPGDLIPSEHQLQRDFSVSRNTAQKAIDELVQEGFLTRAQGKGTFVAAPKFEQALTGFYSFSNAMRSQGIIPRVHVVALHESQAKTTVARHLGIAPGDPVTQLTRVRFADTEPIMLETSYIPVAIAPGLATRQFEESNLYTTLGTDYGVLVVKAKEIFEPVLIRELESRWLGVPVGLPALLLDRIAYTSTGQPVEFCRSIVRGDRCRFYTELL